MSNYQIEIVLDGDAGVVQRVRNGLANRLPLHRRIAQQQEQVTRAHLVKIAPSRHKTADRLGAKRSGHLTEAAKEVESTASSESAVLRIPADTGLRRAFQDFVVTPSRSKYLTLPAHALTYGKAARKFPKETFRFALLGRYTALVFRSGPFKGKVAYWLKKEVFIKQDRDLLPSDKVWLAVASQAARNYVNDLARGDA